MVQAGPVGDGRVVEYNFTYTISDKWIEDRMDFDGIELPREWSIAFALRDLPDPSSRQRARKLWRIYHEFGGEAELDEPIDDPIEFMFQLEEWIASEEERIKYEDQLREQAEMQRELETRRFEQEMQAWIEARGSGRMKAARARGYKVNPSYARARGREELPGAWIDTSGRAEYRERVDPSAEALALEGEFEEWLERHGLELRTRIVWLVEPPTGFAEEYEDADFERVFEGVDAVFEQQEALLISNYLNRYEAFLMIDEDLRAPVDEEDD
ncbi:MAG: hypothetical protein ACM3N0_11625 [Chloroflexota bacterium]